jgi:hypothetical protein
MNDTEHLSAQIEAAMWKARQERAAAIRAASVAIGSFVRRYWIEALAVAVAAGGWVVVAASGWQ